MEQQQDVEAPVAGAPVQDGTGFNEFMMKVVGVLIVIGCVAWYALPYGLHPQRWFDPSTKLGATEQYITDVASEFTRRSPAFRKMIDEYGQCGRSCGPGFHERFERTIRAEWPDIYDRLAVQKDWVHANDGKPTLQHWIFLDLYFEYGERAKRECVPKMSLYAGTTKTWYLRTVPYGAVTFDAFVCTPPETSLPRG